MANLNKNAIWVNDVYQLSTSDPILGGEPIFDLDGKPTNGHANAQAQQLTNRTEYLKQRVDVDVDTRLNTVEGDVDDLRDDLANATDPAKGAGMVGHRSPLAGAVGRTLSEKLGDTVSVKDFGATGDGVTDDTAAFQLASATGFPVWCPNPVYKVTAAISGNFWSARPVAIVGGGAVKISSTKPVASYASADWFVRPVFLRQTVSITSGSNLATVTDGSQWRLGDYILISGAAPGTAYSKKFTITASPARSGDLFIAADGFIFNTNNVSGGVAVLATDTAAQVAAKIRAGAWAGWTVSGADAEVIFTRNASGTTVGASWSDINLLSIPVTETMVEEGTGQLLARVDAIAGNVLTLSASATATVSSAICYLEHGTQLQAAIAGGITDLYCPAGSYIVNTGLKFTQDGSGLRGDGINQTTFYAIGGVGTPVVEFESNTAGRAIFSVRCSDIFIDMQNARRPGVTMRRLWDGSSAENILLDNVSVFYTGFSIRRHSSQAVPIDPNDQTVVSQSVALKNVHSIVRSNGAGVSTYYEYVQEMTMDNVKAGFSADSNALTGTVAAQFEGCRGVTGTGCSFFGAGKAVLVSSVAGLVRGIALVGCTFETNSRNLSVDGGTASIDDIEILAPRCIGGGAGQFYVARCNGGMIDATDRPVFLDTTAISMRVITRSPGVITDSGVNNSKTTIPIVSGVTTLAYAQGVSLSGADATVELTAGLTNFKTYGADTAQMAYPFGASDVGMLLAANRAGTVTISQVSIGAVDSGGSGFRTLRVAN